MTHPDMPGGYGEFRVTSWRLNKDFSIDIQGRTTTDSMYELTSGPKPADVTADPVPVELYAVPRGSILGGRTYYVAVCARTSDGTLSPPSNILQVDVPSGTNTNRITISDIAWPSGTWAGYSVFGGLDYPELLCDQGSVDEALPASITLVSEFCRSTWTFPSPFFQFVRLKAKRIVHSGVIGYPIDAVGPGTLTVSALVDPADDWTGRVLSVISDASDGSAAIWNFTATAYDSATGTFTCTSDPEAAGVEPGDPLIIRVQPDTHTALTLGDSKFQNKLYPAGMLPDGEVGHLVRIIAGTGRGQVRRIAANTATTLGSGSGCHEHLHHRGAGLGSHRRFHSGS
jgi:hypothetical protein